MGFQTKLFISFAFFLAVAAGFMFFFSLESEKKLAAQIESDLENIIKPVQFTTDRLSAEKSADREALTRMIEEASKMKAVHEVNIVNSTHEVVASSNPQKVGRPFKVSGKEMVIHGQLGTADSSGKHARYIINIPIMREGKPIGVLQASIVVSNFHWLLGRLYYKNMVIMSSALLALLIACFLVTYQLNRPLLILSRSAEQVASGDLSVTLVSRSKDEIGRLTENFDGMVRKLSVQKELEERMRSMERRAILSETASILSHEIRNPLNLINLTADHLAHEYQPENPAIRENFLSLITSLKAQVQHLNGMVSDFLAIGKPLKLQKTDFFFVALIADVHMVLKQQLISRGIKLQVDASPELALRADAEQMRLVLMNLIANAVEAIGNRGAITIRAHTISQEAVIDIIDTGPGIAPEDLDKLFTPYFSKRPGGTGLGLALSKRIVEEHGGHIAAFRQPERGSRFEIRLPAKG
jgi:signal transduction histidine kinase